MSNLSQSSALQPGTPARPTRFENLPGFWRRIPIRARLTIWYVLLMAITFALAGGYLLFRFQANLVKSVDDTLQLAVSQSLSAIEDESEMLAFDQSDYNPARQFAGTNFALRLLSTDGKLLDTLGSAQNVPQWGAPVAGLSTPITPGDDERWRIYTQVITNQDGIEIGWIQAAQSLESMTDSLQDFRDQLLWLLPLILLFAGLGGTFLAGRMLKPIDRITRTAAEIEASDLSQRIEYQGPADEIGRLAQTFDRMLERLRAAFERERRFTGDAAHELRTPLTVLKGQLEVTLSRNRSRAEYQRTLNDLSAQVERLIRLSNALLFLSRSDQRQLTWEPASLNLVELLAVILEQIQPLVDEKSLVLTTEIPDELPITGDTDHLIRLFLNLLDNAVKYTPAGGQINLQASRALSGVRVVLHNSGPGIPVEHLPHLFERFYRVEADRSSQSGGSGLGLAICREIVRLHGGTIEVQSQSEQGVSFTVSLPIKP
jgi:heavy metal sensor kinase